jgi:predicted transcriptional regulator YdeE
MKTEAFVLGKDVNVFYVKARSFPEGIASAFEQLQRLLRDAKGRQFYGLSRPNEKGVIEYKAAVEELKPDEGRDLGCERMVIKKGTYSGTVIRDYQKHIEKIQATFQELLQDPKLDPQGYCVEMYLGDKDVRCMVRLVD